MGVKLCMCEKIYIDRLLADYIQDRYNLIVIVLWNSTDYSKKLFILSQVHISSLRPLFL